MIRAPQACELLGGASEVESIDFSAYTAGTGNAGTTILSATVRQCFRVLTFDLSGHGTRTLVLTALLPHAKLP